MAPTLLEVRELLKPLLQKDLRNQCRARNLSPAGSREALLERLEQHMLDTGDLTLVGEFTGELLPSAVESSSYQATVAPPAAGTTSDFAAIGFAKNNYVRPEGQNVGNFLTDRSSSRVLAPPGGMTSVFLC